MAPTRIWCHTLRLPVAKSPMLSLLKGPIDRSDIAIARSRSMLIGPSTKTAQLFSPFVSNAVWEQTINSADPHPIEQQLRSHGRRRVRGSGNKKGGVNREIRRLQSSTHLLVSKVAMARLVKEVVEAINSDHNAQRKLPLLVHAEHNERPPFLFKKSALQILHHAAESFLVHLLSESYVYATLCLWTARGRFAIGLRSVLRARSECDRRAVGARSGIIIRAKFSKLQAH